MMHKLISKYGNEVVYTEDQRKMDRLITWGFRMVDNVSSTPKQTGEKGKRKNETNKNRTRTNIRRIPKGE